MSVIYIPCLNVDNPNLDTGLSIGVGVGQGGGETGGITPGIEFRHPEIPITFTIIPVPPFLSIGINFRFWADLFGLGETRIEREKEEIQDVLTPIFRFLKKGYGFPLRDDHALQFSSDHVQAYMRERPDLDFIRPSMYPAAQPLAQSVFVDNTPSQGQRERIVNQFLANAADNKWPLNATIWVWNAMLEAAKPECRQDKGRWLKNPMAVEKIAQYSALLHYMPLGNFASAVSEHKFNDPDGRKIVTHWLNNPQLVAGIPQVLEIPPWAAAYKSPQDGGGQSGNPYETQQIADRAPIQQLWQGVKYQRPWYPDLIYVLNDGLFQPDTPVEPTPKPPDYEQQPGNPPWPGDNVVEIPPQPQGPQGWPQYPDCPPWNQRPQPQDPEPQPQPPDEPGQGQDGKCDPDCQVQIDYLKERVQFWDNWINLGLVPRIDNLEDWVRDLEHRVPGPLPPLPNPVPFPPWLPPEEIPTDPGDLPTEPTEGGGNCNFTDEECKRLHNLADPTKLCKIVTQCEREIVCEELPFCDETGGIWGGMTECWQNANITPNRPVAGAFAGGDYPLQAARLMVRAFQQSFGLVATPQASNNLVPLNIEDEGRWDGTAQRLALNFVDFYRTGVNTSTRQSYPLPSRPWIFSDPASEEAGRFKYRTLALRADEIDPCTGEPPQVGTLPVIPDYLTE